MRIISLSASNDATLDISIFFKKKFTREGLINKPPFKLLNLIREAKNYGRERKSKYYSRNRNKRDAI